MKRIFKFSVLMVIAMMAMTACQEDKVSVTGVSLSPKEDFLAIAMNNTYQLTATVSPSNATEKGVIWSSSNPNAATVVGGKITGMMPGPATIVATTVDGGKSASIDILVTNPVVGLVFKESLIKLGVGEKVIPKFSFMPPSAINKSVRWTSSNPAIISADATTGELTGKAVGKVTVTVISLENENIKGECEAEVNPIAVTGVTLGKNTLMLQLNKAETLTYSIIPPNADNKEVTWSSSKPGSVSVSSTGAVTAVSGGSSVITVTTNDGGFTASCTVTVNLLRNAGFEEPDDNTNVIPTDLYGWTHVLKAWFNAYYGPDNTTSFTDGNDAGQNGGSANVAGTNFAQRSQAAYFTGTQNGADIAAVLTGKYAGSILNGQSGGLYQVITVEPGKTYIYGADVGWRVNNTANQTIRPFESIKILTPDGLTTTHDKLVIPNTPVTVNGTTAFSLQKGLRKEVTIPAGVTQVRFQIDKRTWPQSTNAGAAPVMAYDECIFILKE